MFGDRLRRWFAGAAETRESGYTEQVLAAELAGASGARLPGRTGAAAVASATIARAFASLDPEPESAAAVLSRRMLYGLGAQLALSGQAVYLARDSGEGRRLFPAASWIVHGRDVDPETWTYDLDVSVPDGVRTFKRVRSGDVAHVVTSDGRRPWRGRSPLAAGIGAAVEDALESDAGRSIYVGVKAEEGGDKPDDRMRGLLRDARRSGKPAIVNDPEQTRQERSTLLWSWRRWGSEPPEELVKLHAAEAAAQREAAGLPAGLSSPGAGSLAAWRLFVLGGLRPLAMLAADELGRALRIPGLKLNTREIGLADVAARARAYATLVGKEKPMDPAEAAKIVGF